MEVQGVIKSFLDIESGTSKTSGNEWKKQSFVISNNDGYQGKEQLYCFEVFGAEKVDNLTKYQEVGDNVKVSYNIQTNEWKGKYFTGLQAWRIEKLDGATPQQATQQQAPPNLQAATDDLPF